MSPAPGTAAPAARTRFTELDGLRGVAALAVIFFHLRDYILRVHPPDFVAELVGGSYLMVDLFFVLSGFVLSKKMLSTTTWEDVRRFSVMRIRRFAPLHVTAWGISVVIVFLTLLWQLSGDPDAPRRLAFSGDGSQSLTGFASSLFLFQGFVGPEFSGYSAAWSLSIELYCNILIVAGIALVGLFTKGSWKWIVGPVSALIGAALLLMRSSADPNTLGFVGSGRGMLGLGTGMVVYQVYLLTVRHQQRRHGAAEGAGLRRLAGAGAVLAMVVLATASYWSHIVKREHFLLMAPVAALCVYMLAVPSGGPVHRLFNTRVVQWLGSRSFAVYALHGPVLHAIEWTLHFLGYNPLHLGLLSLLVIITELVVALAAAEIGHRWIERSWEKRAAARRRNPGGPGARHARSGPPGVPPESLPAAPDVTARPPVDLRELQMPGAAHDHDVRSAGSSSSAS